MAPPLLAAPGLVPGRGSLAVERVAGASAVTGARAAAPLKLLVPRPRGPAAWAYAATYGGGLVAGDTIDIDVSVGPGAAALVGTQASTKVYAGEGRPASQSLHARIAEGALLALLPDPVCPFADAVYHQHQRIDLAEGASLALIDMLTSGRAARGERWRFASYRSTTEVHLGGQLALRDALHLEDTPGSSIADRMDRFHALAAVLLLGPALAAPAAALLDRLSGRLSGAPAPLRARLYTAASPVPGGALLRIAGEDPEEVVAFARRALAPLAERLGEDPWSRKY